MQKKLNDIKKNWHEINIALTCADFLGAHQRLRKMILQLKMLKLDVGILMDLPYPRFVARTKKKKEIVWRGGKTE